MSTFEFPFPALVGLDELKLALQLAAIDLRLSVLIRGDKGAGKSTAARGLAQLLDASVPFVTLPIGATEDRLLGGLDIEKAIRGEAVLKRGLLGDADGGVLYVDEVNLLPDHLADALLDTVASGVHTIEREGFSATQSANFVLVGSMNPEEGALRPQLLDRFALAVDVSASLDPDVRAEVLVRRLAYDADPTSFVAEWTADASELSARLATAKARASSVTVSRAMLQHIASRVADYAIPSLRADLAVVRASRALAALEGAPAVKADHVEAVLPLALAHRAKDRPRPPAQPPQREQSQPQSPEDKNGRSDTSERVFSAANIGAPPIVVEHTQSRSGQSARSTASAGPAIRARQTVDPRELDVRPSLLHAVTHTGAARMRADDLHEKVRQPQAGTRFIFVVDSSGSHAVQDRMRLVKGAVGGLLAESAGRHDEVVVISCRGASAQVLLEPTCSPDDAVRALEYLPTGGRTPLAHALSLAAGYVNAHTAVVLVTDGHANVAHQSDDAWADALANARALGCPALVVDTEDERTATGRPLRLAEAMGASRVRLADLDSSQVIRLIREVS